MTAPDYTSTPLEQVYARRTTREAELRAALAGSEWEAVLNDLLALWVESNARLARFAAEQRFLYGPDRRREPLELPPGQNSLLEAL